MSWGVPRESFGGTCRRCPGLPASTHMQVPGLDGPFRLVRQSLQSGLIRLAGIDAANAGTVPKRLKAIRGDGDNRQPRRVGVKNARPQGRDRLQG